MTESLEQRRRRKFAAGVLDQLAAALSGLATATVVAGGVAPAAALAAGALDAAVGVIALVAAAASLIGGALLIGALQLKGTSKVRDDDLLASQALDRHIETAATERSDT